MTKPPCYYPMLIRLVAPLYRLVRHHKSRHLPTHQRELSERFAQKYLPVPMVNSPVEDAVDNLDFSHSSPVVDRGIIWCHAVSLGELNTAYPLLKILLNQGFRLWITSTTQTGFQRVSVLFKDELGQSVNHSFVPVDKLDVVRKFLTHVQPMMAIFIETELWATMLYELKCQNIPSVMVNARLTEKSYQSYAKFSQLSWGMMQNLTAIIAQDEASAQRFVQLGATKEKVHTADSLKWSSFATPDAKNEQLLQQARTWQMAGRPIWLAASTHEGEEALFLEVQQQLLTINENALLILVPRHPERFAEVAQLCTSSGLTTYQRSCGGMIEQDTQVYLADSMGELLAWYGLCDVAVVAGSFVDVGGHNPIEPASLSKPIVMGQFVKNCEVLVQALAQVGALVQVASQVEGLTEAVATWLFDSDQAKKAGQAGAQLVAQKRHAAHTQAQLLMQFSKHTMNGQP